MKIKKVILTSVAALSLFATSAATATSSMTPVVSNASVHKVVRHHKGHKHVKARKHVKSRRRERSVKFNFLFKVVSKGHATKYFYTKTKTPKLDKYARYDGWNIKATKVRGYSIKHRSTYYRVYGDHKVGRDVLPYTTYVSRHNKPIKVSSFTRKNARRYSAHSSIDYIKVWSDKGAHRISKKTFNRLNNHLTRFFHLDK
ncbi:hypothetical protein [Apilactobacillus bombintestini]|uniref:Uncharacterized protein n=1 Tax=Apilactobacillus bombintestini TaxID=2419772 RepID=A0A387ARB7_9LACO|nr:hypothetical protein [Apilactobacillus bombintestini]AYF91989.1 hypothetical protein D7I45_00040 [Apilactobacillus bombintestini]